MGFTESSTIQAALIEWAEEAGWEHVPRDDLPRDEHDVLVESWVRDALIDLNPELDPNQAPDSEANLDAVIHQLNQAILGAQNGLIAANERLTVMLRGDHSFTTVDGQHVPRRFFDFEDPANNRLVVSDEVTIRGNTKPRRFDVVYYVNGFPLVVAETKTPVKHQVSWCNAADDIYGTYEVEYPQFFAPNVFNVATDGRDFRMAPVRAVPDPESEIWAPWGSLEDNPKSVTEFARVERAARLLLRPEVILPILRDFAMYRHARDASETDIKLLPRYPQFEAALAIHDKVLDGRPGGLIWHHQGSGKTELMAFASARILNDPKVVEQFGSPPTVIVIADRKDLVRQTAEMFETAGMPRLEVPGSSRELWKILKSNQPCVVITTVHKFADAGHLSDRANIIVLVDEAHRSQEGTFGKAWRAAVPNAKFFGATGTAIEDGKRSTFRLFGDPDDPDFIMSRYTPEQSMADGFTKPVIVEGRSVGFDLNKDDLDVAFDELAETEDLDEDKKVFLSNRASHVETVLSNPDRIQAVCADIVEHFMLHVAPLGQKAQVVAYNRNLVVAYAHAIEARLAQVGQAREVAVIMHVNDAKGETQDFKKYLLTDEQEEALKRRFKNVEDPLSFVVVTAKWMTGFNAPIEGVLYLDKPLKAANLFQTITRPNRPWKNPLTGQRKEYGRVVDYIGLAKAIGEALLGPQVGENEPEAVHPTDIQALAVTFLTDMVTLDAMFEGIDKSDTGYQALALAHERIPEDSDARSDFIDAFVGLQTIWEFLDPHPTLQMAKPSYRWYAKLYESVRPKTESNTFLWERFGAKTLALVHSHMSNVRVRANYSRNVTLDAKGIEKVKEIAEALRQPLPEPDAKNPGDVLGQVLDTIEDRLRRLAAGPDEAVYKSLAERIEKLRDQAISSVEDSLAFLEKVLKIAQDVVAAERAASNGAGDAPAPVLVDPKRGALTQIVEENAPADLHNVIPEVVSSIDQIVDEVAYSGWTTSDAGDKKVRRELRTALRKFGLPAAGVLFDKTYEYVRENY
ncbi:type I restriction endonuclease subunit R [Aeromicrobium fastidiosum]|uniref:Type I restriction enzyme endonuclease subunit n=1 Tax=Aeromicrobium fastidiosum TaxID=52699 RepID=A0A641AL51_9ACTN|nr:HsdR family type I site-specific deoxyribonuclease [Aeromicrobium fastidiosum]KAA1375978.1 type I restriction endonuclease subunit R [Aeromicrobium fastidiosum]MBP2392161.1 type I restriction enzyme R subunit [Aeromicrobium fastidiosum]